MLVKAATIDSANRMSKSCNFWLANWIRNCNEHSISHVEIWVTIRALLVSKTVLYSASAEARSKIGMLQIMLEIQ